MKREEMIALIGNMFVNTYVAGDRKDLDSFRSARADRDRLIDVVLNLYAELERESYEREQFEVELKNANKEIINLREQLYCRSDVEACKEMFDVGSKLTDPDNPDSPLWSDYAPGPEDMDPELRDCMPFPDVEEMAPAEDVQGSDE